jgi:hypothetical protein
VHQGEGKGGGGGGELQPPTYYLAKSLRASGTRRGTTKTQTEFWLGTGNVQDSVATAPGNLGGASAKHRPQVLGRKESAARGNRGAGRGQGPSRRKQALQDTSQLPSYGMGSSPLSSASSTRRYVRGQGWARSGGADRPRLKSAIVYGRMSGTASGCGWRICRSTCRTCSGRRSHGGTEASRKQREEPTTRHKGNWRVPCSCLCVETPVVARRCFSLPRSHPSCAGA